MISSHLLEGHTKLHIVKFGNPDAGKSQVQVMADYYSYKEIVIPDEKFAICCESLPSAEELLRSYSVLRESYFGHVGPFKGLLSAIQQFVEHYCRLAVDLPLVRALSFNGCIGLIQCDPIAGHVEEGIAHAILL